MIGKYPAKLDEKGRLFVPSKLRGELGNSFVVTLGVNCGHRCLTVYTAEEWQRLSENFNALSIAQRSGATSLLFMNAAECNPDKQFRFSLTPFLSDPVSDHLRRHRSGSYDRRSGRPGGDLGREGI